MLQQDGYRLKIANVRHRGLRRFIENDDASGLPAAFVEKIRNIVSFLLEMDDPEELKALRSLQAHQLTGDRRGTWSLTVSRNWRITFTVDEGDKAIVDLDYEDYH
jgi:proteic killer suppression protein